MRMSRFRFTRMKPAVVLALAWPALAGCGNKNLVRVTGQVVEAGEPYRLADSETIQIDFSTADNAFPPLALGTFAKRDGSFVVDMNDGTGRGLPPGKYKVRLNGEGTSLKKKANAKLFKEAHVLEVTKAASPHLTIDLSTGTVTP
jgi:hypothetical protein